jgi:hypothetical protein
VCGVRCAGLVVGSIVLNLGNYVQSWRQVGDNCFSDIASLKTKMYFFSRYVPIRKTVLVGSARLSRTVTVSCN